MKHLLHTIFRSLYSIIYIEFLGKRKLSAPVLIPVNVLTEKTQKINIRGTVLYKMLGCFVLVTLFSTVSQAQTYLSPSGNLNITTNTTYSGAGIYTGTTTVKAGVTVIFTGGVSLSNSAKFVIEAGATVIINSGGFSTSSSTEATTATGSKLIIIAGGLNLSNSSKFTSNGALAVRDGGLSISSSATLGLYGLNQDTIRGAVSLNNSTTTTIDTGVELYIDGDITSTSSAGMAVNGNVAVDGNYQSWNSAKITGTGDITTTGSMNAGGSSTIFGVNPYSCSGPDCNGRNSCGRTITASTPSTGVCLNSSVILTGVLSGSGTKAYQWQVSTTLGGTYSNITGATSSTYTFTATAARYYKVRITVSGCASTSNIIPITINTPAVAPAAITGNTSICAGESTTLTVSGGNLGTDGSAVWYDAASCGSFIQNWTSQPYATIRTTVNGANGILNVTSAFDSWIEMYGLGTFNPNIYKYINIRYRVNSGDAQAVQMYFTNATYTTANENAVVVSPLISDGNWQVLTIDMSTHPLWTSSTVTGWRYDFASGVANMDIDYISLTAKPAGGNNGTLSSTFSPLVTTIYQVRYESVCNFTTCQAVTITVNSPATAVAGSDISMCAGSTAVPIIAGSSAANTSGITWTSNGTAGTISAPTSLTNAKYTPSPADIAAGSRTVTLTATGQGACPNVTSTKTITIISSPAAIGTLTGTATVCKEQTITYSIPSVANAASYNWTVPTGAAITAGTGTTSITVSYAGASVTSGSVSVDAINTCATTSKSLAITINNTCANSWIGVTSTDWNTTSNWSLGMIPSSAHDVMVPASTPFSPTVSATANVASFTNNNTLTVAFGAILNVYGNITNNSNVSPASGSTVAFKGNSAQTVSGVPVLYNVQVANTSGGVALSSAVTVRGTLTLTSGVLTTNSNLTVNFDTGGNIAYNSTDAGSISGSVTGRRDAIARTHYIGAPFNGVTSAQVGATTPLYYNNYWKMYAKNFANQGWLAVTDATTAMSPGTGYSLALPNAASLIFTGTYSHSYTLPGATYSNAAAGKYILIGNPYPSTLDWNKASGWTKTNVANAVYYWDAAGNKVSSYVAGVSTNGGTQYIPAMQAFMVTTTGTGGSNSSVAINNNARLSTQNPSFLRTGADETIRIKLTGANAEQWDDAVIRFNEMATTAFDTDWDAYKILSRGPSPLVYTTLGEDIYSINSVAEAASLPAVDVLVYIPADGNYTLTITNSDPTTDYILIDKKLGTENLLSGSDYKFSGAGTDAADRFQLQLRTAVTTGTQLSQKGRGLQIGSATKGFVIQTDQFAGNAAGIEIMDMNGKSISVFTSNLSAAATYVPVELADGAYLVKVTVEGNTFAGLISLIK
ncbi:beta strand repeat-containing protein [Cytophaga hutchinsonii]|uniref:beta strand repeat-containing protein n=1 Tax=Cytophaga hutchinsonii TaxID=985 RepID=UPI000038F171|nr:T9SS type A sorting domain-containing protein [Cytophaga hutchinsonii]SFX14080.1 hypothetical protein SAMN04487930_101672 [Cytophaga hutchinsonii ATCC 33406]